MGLCASKNDDKKKEGELEELKIEDIKISNYDSAFQQTKDPANSVVGMNNTLLGACDKICELFGLVPPPPFGKALKEMFANLKKECGDAMKTFKLDVDTSGLADGKIHIVPKFDFDPVKVLPEKYQKAWGAIFGDDGLINQIKGFVGNLTGITGQLKDAKSSIEALPTKPDEIKSAAEGAGISGMDLMKVPGKIAHNVKEAGRVPDIIKTFLNSIKSTVDQLQEAVKELGNGGGSEGKSAEKGEEPKKEEPKKEEPKKEDPKKEEEAASSSAAAAAAE